MRDTAAVTNKGESCNIADFPAFALVDGNSEENHNDPHDFRSGYCCISVVGDFEGGEIEFPHLKLRFLVRPGDIIFFRSHLLYHRSAKVTKGRRLALVLFANQNIFTCRAFQPFSSLS